MNYGYARVSTTGQDTEIQESALSRAGVDRVYTEKKSGANMRSRPVLLAILDQLRPGDTLTVYKLDRVARSLRDLLTILDQIEARGASFVSLGETIDTSTPAGQEMMQLLGAFSQFERDMIVERTKTGLEAAIARGVRLGRPMALPPILANAARTAVEVEGKSMSSVAREFDVHVSTIRRLCGRLARPAPRTKPR